MTLLASILDSLCLDIQHFRVFFLFFYSYTSSDLFKEILTDYNKWDLKYLIPYFNVDYIIVTACRRMKLYSVGPIRTISHVAWVMLLWEGAPI